MPLMQVADRVLVTFAGSLCGQRTLNTFLYRVTAKTGDITIVNAMTALNAHMLAGGGLRTAFLGVCPLEYELQQCWFQVITPVRSRKYSFNVGDFGTFDGHAYTPNTQGSITRLGEFAGRKYVGGIRIPIGADDNCAIGGFLTAGLKAAFGTLSTAMEQEITTAGSVATYKPQVGLPKPPAVSADLDKCVVQDTIRVIRRRTVGLGI